MATAYDLGQVSLQLPLTRGQLGSDWDQASQLWSMIVGLIAEIWTAPAAIHSKQAIACPSQVDCHHHALLGTLPSGTCKRNVCTSSSVSRPFVKWATSLSNLGMATSKNRHELTIENLLAPVLIPPVKHNHAASLTRQPSYLVHYGLIQSIPTV